MIRTQILDYPINICELFAVFCNEPYAILLDSGKPQQTQGRYDVISTSPSQQLFIKDGSITYQDTDKNNHPLSDITQLIQHLNQHVHTDKNHFFCGGWLGFADYDLAHVLEKKITNTYSNQTQFWAGYYQWAIVQDHQLQQTQLVWLDDIDSQLLQHIQQQLCITPFIGDFTLTTQFQPEITFADYQLAFSRIQRYIAAGDCYQVNFAQRFQARFQGQAFAAYLKLRHAVPSPYMAFFRHPEKTILSISPECFITANQRAIISKPIKGTVARGKTSDEDKLLAKQLLHSEKNYAENIMIVDLMRNDFSRFCEKNSVYVDPLCHIESFENVHHLVSTVHGTLKADYSIWDLFFASFPGGSITGAPKIRACQIIQELEMQRRNSYCGSIFIASDNGQFAANIAIRTLVCEENTIYAWAGGGITTESQCEDEYQECFSKINALLNAL